MLPEYPDRAAPGLRSDPAVRLTAWQVSLDRIELDVIRAERSLDRGVLLQTDPWDVPGDYGPLPEELRERAQGILDRQIAVMARIAETLGRTAQHQAVVEALGRSSVPRRRGPIYVDVDA